MAFYLEYGHTPPLSMVGDGNGKGIRYPEHVRIAL